jgi:hypothetical protein
LTQAARDYKNADCKLVELYLRVEATWSRTSSQLEVTKIYRASMNDEQWNIQERILRVLYSKFETATTVLSKLDGYMTSDKRQKIRFVALRDELEEAVTELESWQKRFEPSWLDLVKTAPTTINDTLSKIAGSRTDKAAQSLREALNFRQAFVPMDRNKDIYYSSERLDQYERTRLPHSMVETVTKPMKGGMMDYVFDAVSPDAVTIEAAIDLATRLRESNPYTFGTLKCRAIVRSKDQSIEGFIFRVPDGIATIHSMRGLLLDSQVPGSLTIRLEMARQLAKAVYYIHLYEFVHKNICPETILSLGSVQSDTSAPMLCLVGFKVLRYADGITNAAKLGSRYWLYQHPQRHGPDRSTFVMQHDIYSLGVCLLEIGLWESLLSSEGKIDPSDLLKLGDANPTPARVKDEMVAISRTRLRIQMGDKYSKVVETCLTCLDSDNVHFGDPEEFTDDNGVKVGARYMEKVLDAINTISL